MTFKYKPITKQQVQQRQDAINNPGGKNKANNIFKVKEQPQVIRIIPYVHNENGNPFLEKNFHYGTAQGTILCPRTFGQNCPICEFATSLWKKGEKDMAKKFFNSDRVYVPVIDRGNVQQEPKFWGVSKTNYQDILNTIADPDYGDVVHPFQGRDLTVTKLPPAQGSQFGKVIIKFKPKQSPIAESQKQIEDILNKCVNFDKVYPLKTYEELERLLQKTISGQKKDQVEGNDNLNRQGTSEKNNKGYMKEIDEALGA